MNLKHLSAELPTDILVLFHEGKAPISNYSIYDGIIGFSTPFTTSHIRVIQAILIETAYN